LAGFDFLKQRDGELSAPFVSIMDHLPPDTQREFRVGTMQIPNEATAKRYQKSYAKMVEFTGLLHREGVSIVAGTDTFAGFGLHSELALYVQAGLTPAQAIKVATYDAAKRLGQLAQLGSIAEGKRAELILVKGQPTQSIEELRRITLVISQGHAIYPNEIYPLIGVKPFVEEQAKMIKRAAAL
jgi:imidazolonepropionase-like amidohydrolase